MNLAAFPLSQLRAPLSQPERHVLRTTLQELLLWQRDLGKWPVFPTVPDATPIISLYANGALCGCAGMSEGPPAARIFRAFVQALGDARFGGLGPEARAELRCRISYAVRAAPIDLAHARESIEVGTHGLALASAARPVTLLPDVATDNSLDARGLLDTLEQKGNAPRGEWPAGALYTFETESVVARLEPAPELEQDPVAAAATWLARRVDADGRVTFGINPRTAEWHQLSPMFHGRVAILIRALFSQKNGRGAAVRARRFLEAELVRALAGQHVEQFPEQPAFVAGTLALASLAGIELTDALHAYAKRPETRAVPWHAAQVVAALGKHAPSDLWQACQRNLEAEPWAPWTALAAKARGDTATLERAVAALVAAVPERGPHAGGVGPGTVPEIARTAATVEALMGLDSPEARAACTRARAFLLKSQIHGDTDAPGAGFFQRLLERRAGVARVYGDDWKQLAPLLDHGPNSIDQLLSAEEKDADAIDVIGK